VSNHLTSITYKRKLGCRTRKAVLALMADKASDDGRGIWASKQSLADELDLTKRTVISAIQAMIDDGLLMVIGERRCATGHTVEYAINVDVLEAVPLVDCWQRREDAKVKAQGPTGDQPRSPPNGKGQQRGEAPSPVQEVHRCSGDTGRGESASPKPPLEPLPLSPPDGGDAPRGLCPDQDDPGAPFPSAGRRGVAGHGRSDKPPFAAKPHRLPVDWTPPPIANLPPLAAALAQQWPQGAYATVCERFRLHWHSQGGARALKLDWLATLGKWIMTDHAGVMRDAKAGLSFAAAGGAGGQGGGLSDDDLDRLYAPPLAVAQQDARSAAVHDALRSAVPESAYRRTFAPLAILTNDQGQVRIIAVRQWMLDAVESGPNRRVLNIALRGGMGRAPTWIGFEIDNRKERT
jgi:hypothetical protein